MRLTTVALFASSAAAQCPITSTLCEPSGATSLTPPQIQDPDFTSLYRDLLSSSLLSFKPKRSLPDSSSLEERQSTGSSLCCTTSLSCLLISNLNIPFCYDRFTTNFFLPDNSFGTLFSGTYTSSSGTANFKTGNFTLKDGTTGNIYPDGSAEKSSVATLSVPPQFTGSGVGSAIPASELGGVIVRTFTRTLQESTIPGTTVTEGVSTVTEGGGSVRTTSLVGSTIAPSTVAATETVITTTEIVAATSTESEVSSASATGNAAGGRLRIEMAVSLAPLRLIVCIL